MKTDPIPLIYPFENLALSAGLAAINATPPLFKTEAKHLDAWVQGGCYRTLHAGGRYTGTVEP